MSNRGIRMSVWVAGALALLAAAAYAVPMWRWRAAYAYLVPAPRPPAAATRVAAPSVVPIAAGNWLSQVPGEWRDYLARAEQADQAADRLARCNAFPDLPGNAWPANLAPAHCEYQFGANLTLAEIAKRIDGKRFEELDALFARDLARHFSATDFSEAIHRDFDAFDGSYDADRRTQAWVDADSQSPFALAARGLYYWQHARDARGDDYADETPDANFQRMHEYALKASDYYHRALAIEPRLLPAHVGLIGLGLIDSSLDGEAAFASAQRVDPGCYAVASIRMRQLSPRWGGSYAQMQAYADTLAPQVPTRPLLALAIAAIPVDQADVALGKGDVSQALAVSTPAVMRSTEPQLAGQLVRALLMQEDKGRWDALAYSLSASRFNQCYCFGDFDLANLLRYQAHRPDWAVRYYQRAIERNPEDARAHALLGSTYLDMGQNGRAVPEFRMALSNKETHRDALIGLTVALRHTLEFPAALEVSSRLVAEMPNDPNAWRLRYEILSAGHDPQADAARRKFISVADRHDPFQRKLAEIYEAQGATSP